jgi:hypothetical protein
MTPITKRAIPTLALKNLTPGLPTWALHLIGLNEASGY